MSAADGGYVVPSEEQLLADFDRYLRELAEGGIDAWTVDIFDRWIAAREAEWRADLRRQQVVQARQRAARRRDLAEQVAGANARVAISAEQSRAAKAEAEVIGQLLAAIDPNDKSI